jgi:phosphatidylglycerophosphatase C
MNVYDFDKTIYPQDSSIEFYVYNLKKHPDIILLWPMQLLALILYKLKRITKTEMKTLFYRYFEWIPKIDQNVLDFWTKNKHKMNVYYLQQKQSTDVIISASPEFLLKPICDELGVHLIASIVDPKTGRSEENCYGEAKPKRFRETYPEASIEAFYSDSLSDDPMAKISKTAYLVLGQDIQPWPKA